MDAPSDIVLPCSHKFCAACASHWIREHYHCPLCRRHIPARDAEKEQWQLETWSKDDLADHVQEVETKLHALYSRFSSETCASQRCQMSFHKLYVDFLHLS